MAGIQLEHKRPCRRRQVAHRQGEPLSHLPTSWVRTEERAENRIAAALDMRKLLFPVWLIAVFGMRIAAILVFRGEHQNDVSRHRGTRPGPPYPPERAAETWRREGMRVHALGGGAHAQAGGGRAKAAFGERPRWAAGSATPQQVSIEAIRQ